MKKFALFGLAYYAFATGTFAGVMLEDVDRVFVAHHQNIGDREAASIKTLVLELVNAYDGTHPNMSDDKISAIIAAIRRLNPDARREVLGKTILLAPHATERDILPDLLLFISSLDLPLKSLGLDLFLRLSSGDSNPEATCLLDDLKSFCTLLKKNEVTDDILGRLLGSIPQGFNRAQHMDFLVGLFKLPIELRESFITEYAELNNLPEFTKFMAFLNFDFSSMPQISEEEASYIQQALKVRVKTNLFEPLQEPSINGEIIGFVGDHPALAGDIDLINQVLNFLEKLVDSPKKGQAFIAFLRGLTGIDPAVRATLLSQILKMCDSMGDNEPNMKFLKTLLLTDPQSLKGIVNGYAAFGADDQGYIDAFKKVVDRFAALDFDDRETLMHFHHSFNRNFESAFVEIERLYQLLTITPSHFSLIEFMGGEDWIRSLSIAMEPLQNPAVLASFHQRLVESMNARRERQEPMGCPTAFLADISDEAVMEQLRLNPEIRHTGLAFHVHNAVKAMLNVGGQAKPLYKAVTHILEHNLGVQPRNRHLKG